MTTMTTINMIKANPDITVTRWGIGKDNQLRELFTLPVLAWREASTRPAAELVDGECVDCR
jgi:hypothetical protein